jgi:hypothetical protein
MARQRLKLKESLLFIFSVFAVYFKMEDQQGKKPDDFHSGKTKLIKRGNGHIYLITGTSLVMKSHIMYRTQ